MSDQIRYGLFFDTETTGLANFNKPAVDPEQPKLAQIGGLLMDLQERKELGTIDLIVYPSSWEIPQEAALVHGISTKLAQIAGVNLDSALLAFDDMLQIADVVVAHNYAFDRIVIERAFAMIALANGEDVLSHLDDKRHFDTMKVATPVVKKRGKKPIHNTDYKWPKLTETYEFLFGKGFSGAHNAIIDVRACAEVFFRLIDMGFGGDEYAHLMRGDPNALPGYDDNLKADLEAVLALYAKAGKVKLPEIVFDGDAA